MKLRAALAAVTALAVLATPAVAQPQAPPIVMVVFDGLPVKLLQTPDGRIDAARYPNFAALAGDSTWFPNATTIHESTRFSAPAILDGKYPRPGQAADWRAHPQSIFTLLQGAYRMNVWEEASQVCPPSLCPKRAKGDVISRLAYGRVERFRSAIRAIDRGGRPQLTFMHVFFPHEPRQYLPDGRRYQPGRSLDPAIDGTGSYHRRFLTEQGLQRTLLQLQFTDRLLGELVRRLRAAGIWDEAAVAVMSDHGESFDVKRTPAGPFRVGQLSFRRAVTPSNVEDVAPIALFLKYPGSGRGRVDDRWVRTIDVVPTLLDLAGVARPADLDGRSLRGDAYRGESQVSVRRQDGGAVTMPLERFRRRVADSHRRRLRLFGSGTESLFAFGPARDLHGVAVSDLPAAKRSRLRASIYKGERFNRVRGSFIPAHVLGRLRGGRPQGRTLVFALNGTVAGSAPSYPPLGKSRFNFSVMLPPEAFKPGRNELRVYELTAADELRPLG